MTKHTYFLALVSTLFIFIGCPSGDDDDDDDDTNPGGNSFDLQGEWGFSVNGANAFVWTGETEIVAIYLFLSEPVQTCQDILDWEGEGVPTEGPGGMAYVDMRTYALTGYPEGRGGRWKLRTPPTPGSGGEETVRCPHRMTRSRRPRR